MSRVQARAEARARARATRVRLGLVAAAAACVLAGFVVLATLGGGSTSAGPAAPPGADDVVVAPTGERATVVGVADPVTLDVRLPRGEIFRVRALGVQPGAPCYADDALAFAQRILGGASVQLVPGPAGSVTDPFDRRLLQVNLDGNDYGVLAAQAGVAMTYGVGAAPEAMAPIRAAEQRARDAGRGIWAGPCEPGPDVPGPDEQGE